MTERRPGFVGSRREFVGAVGALAAAGLTGCMGRGPATVDVAIYAQDADTRRAVVRENDKDVEPGDYVAWEFTLDWEHELTFDVEVTSGPRVQLYLVRDEEMDALREGDEFEAVESGLWGSVRDVEESVQVAEGHYWLVAINDDVEPVNMPSDDEPKDGDGNTTDNSSTEEQQ